MNLIITSKGFENNSMIPKKYTFDGDNVSPQLEIKNIPEDAKSLAIIMDDPDAEKVVGKVWVHWVIWNIPVCNEIEENFSNGIEGVTSYNKNTYGGPNPPAGGVHRYFFKVYALSDKLDIPEDSDKEALEKAIQSKLISQGEIVGLYQRK